MANMFRWAIVPIVGLAWIAAACNGPESVDPDSIGSGVVPVSTVVPTRIRIGPEWASHETALPRRSGISISFAPGDYAGLATISGDSGTVPAGQDVVTFDLQLGIMARARADREGAFEVAVSTLAGSHIFVGIGYTDEGPGILIPIEPSPRDDGMRTVGGGRLADGTDSVPWIFLTSLDLDELRKNEPVGFDGRLVLPSWFGLPPTDGVVEVLGLMLTDAAGRPVGYGAEFVSAFLTPTGLPIERSILTHTEMRSVSEQFAVNWRMEGEFWVADVSGEVAIPSSWNDGLYRLTAQLTLESRVFPVEEYARVGNCCEAPIGNFQIGVADPPRLATTVLADVLSEGSLGGIRPIEQESWFDVSPRIVTRHDPVVPRVDVDDQSWSYNLEPFLPMFGAVDRSPPAIPPALLDLATSELTVTVQRPDGGEDRLGPAPLSHLAFRKPNVPVCLPAGIATGGHLSGLVQARGAEDTFAYTFSSDGDHLITLSGTVSDFDGRSYDLSGQYPVTVGRQLKLSASFLPGTPFEIGDDVPLTVQVWPTVPVEVEFSALHVQADGTTDIRVFTGTASDGGRWDGSGQRLSFESPGEFRIDITARYEDPDGNLWVGRLRTGSAVASAVQEIRAHGRRSIGAHAQWYYRPDLDPPLDLYGVDSGYGIVDAGLMWPPFANGDIQWGVSGNRGDNAIALRGGVQILDSQSRLANEAADQFRRFGDPLVDGVSVEEQITTGQMPLVTYADANTGMVGMAPDEIRLWGYTYVSAQRPDIRVREIVEGSEVAETYWLFSDPYYLQSGVGPEGDVDGDYKFLYSAAVIHDRELGEATYAIYGAAWVLTPDEDALGARVLPPFRGAAGGSNSGPIFTVHGREVDMFVMPLGVRPAAILSVGDTFQMAGPLMPTLPSLVSYIVTSPSGVARDFEGRANAVGFYYHAEDDFVINEPGLWTVDVMVTHDGMTSAGMVEEPYPVGGILAPDGTSYTFVATDQDTQFLDINSDLEMLPAASWYCHNVKEATFEASLPPEAVVETAHVSVSMSGTLLVNEELPVTEEGNLKWDLDAVHLNSLAGSFDVERGIADLITVTFHVDGLLDGEPAQWAGRLVTFGARLVAQPFS